MPKSPPTVLGFAVAILLLASSNPAAPLSPAALDYSQAQNWVCRPDLAEACRDDLSAAILEADGTARIEPFQPSDHPAADCFYVYPTVSQSPGFTAEPAVTEAERRSVRQQVERFSSVCRLFTPVYRQFTVTGMKSGFPRPTADVRAAAGRVAQADVIAAWDHYLANDNAGRPVILIGHSQGSAMLIRLIQQRIDGQPVQRRLVSAILPGSFVLVPKGKDVGGTFQTIPPCRSDQQTGCVIVFNTVRIDRPVPADQVIRHEGQESLCTNPAALGGGVGVLKPYLSTSGETIIPDFTAPQPPWTREPSRIDAPFVMPPGLYSAECKDDEHGVYLAISTNLRPDDRRTGALTGDWMARAEATMGLHLIDLNLTAGNLVDVLRAQIAAMAGASAALDPAA
jgi:hypothetical protein